MAEESGASAVAILRRLLAGALDPRQAAAELVALNLPGLAIGSGVFNAEEHIALDRLMPELRWEMSKRASGNLPDVPYGSPEYRAWIASIPSLVDRNDA
ncbi:MAG TPA: hypothetical protein VMD08_14070 [Candidatus Baltobacteraceae bacterium]|nr:hypothetical protein [Candidatus Baltobacteraceae bacterium]